ncbi:hypothetical protein ACWGNE_08820, partial [Streptomyces xiamenensis]
ATGLGLCLVDGALGGVHGGFRCGGRGLASAAARLAAARAAVTAHAEELRLPQENLLAPDTVRRLCWEPPAGAEPELVAQSLRSLGAREWQIEQTVPLLTQALAADA